MELSKNLLIKSTLARLLSFIVLFFAVRFAYFIAVKGRSCVSNDFCFFPPQNLDFTIHYHSAATYRCTVDHYLSVFQDLIADGFLSPISKSLCIETLTGEEIIALKEIGVIDSTGISKKSKKIKKSSPPLILSNYPLSFHDNTFDFQFTNNLDWSGQPDEFGSELCRTLKPGGFLVIHTKSRDLYSLQSLLDLFNCCRLIKSREINGVDSMSMMIIREVVLMKVRDFLWRGNVGSNCSVSRLKRELAKNAEALIAKEPLKPWITLKRNLKNVKYLSDSVDISFKRKYVYVDVGARSYGSSIGGWFRKSYPKQNKSFEIYAIEADKVFFGEYRSKKGVQLLPYAAWVRNETLFFGISRFVNRKIVEKGRGMGRIQPVVQSSLSNKADLDTIEGFDFAEWLKNVVVERDFVVVKLDVEGTEFHLIPRLVETGAICLIDELFLECHYNRWKRCCPGQRGVKYQKTYDQCLQLLNSLRKIGVLVHQWW
jgi:SAM-dependent methyltransferase